MVNLKNGIHELNGEQALDLARARGEAYGSIGFEKSDFQRTADQRMMLLALASKAKTVGFLVNPVKVGDLFDSFSEHVHTNLSIGNIRRLYTITKPISPNNIKSGPAFLMAAPL